MTSDAVRDLALPVAAEASEYTAAGAVAALVEHALVREMRTAEEG